mmetsp:Transcript_37463/g.96769  ORF Transcript_37463/g.96769 Transcript_37463/m.96769 type:complete len:95 (+) Transcript_37463:1535-1819(+)
MISCHCIAEGRYFSSLTTGQQIDDELARSISNARRHLRHVDTIELAKQKQIQSESKAEGLEGLLRKGLSAHRRAIEVASGSRAGVEESTEDWRE